MISKKEIYFVEYFVKFKKMLANILNIYNFANIEFKYFITDSPKIQFFSF
jgi:hypothetical protein